MHTLPRILTATFCLAPLTSLAHPGHADGAPLLHAFTHGLFYLATAISLGILATQAIRRIVMTKQQRTGRRERRK